jgi:hypothetical protein
MADQQIQGLPPGAVVGPAFQQSAPPQVEGLPDGAVVGPSTQAAAPPQATMSNAAPDVSSVDPSLLTSDPVKQAGVKMTMPLIKGLIAVHDKLRDVENMTQEGRQAHPIQAGLGDIANRIEGFLTGNTQHPEDAIGTGQYGMTNNPVLAAVSAVPAAADMATAGEAIARGTQDAPGLIKQVLQGKSVAQEPAKAAVRGAVGAAEDAPLLEGNSTVLDDALANIKQQESAAYKAKDDAAGFDVKAEKANLKNDQYKLKQLGNTDADNDAREKLTAAIQDSQARISDAETKMQEAGIDPKEADQLHQQRMAGQDFKKVIVKNTNSDGSVNVDGLLRDSKNLRFNKFGDRLQQFLGSPEAADDLVSKLDQMQKLGAHAVKAQKIAAWIGGGVAATLGGSAGYDALKHVSGK